jgi:hypothetical protein
MKSILLVVAVATLLYRGVACDFCNSLNGINPYYSEDDKVMIHFLSQRSVSSLEGQPHHTSSLAKTSHPNALNGIHHGGEEGTTESRTTFELAYQHHLSDNVIVTAIIPFSRTSVASSESITSEGFGDATVLSHYRIALHDDDEQHLMLLVGGGVKFPIGKADLQSASGKRLESNLQLGTGSTDVVLNTTLIVQYGLWTLGFDAFGKINTPNTFGERMGHSLSLSLLASHDLYRKNSSLFALIGTAGLRTELSARDRKGGIVNHASGFANTYGYLGTQVVYDWIRFDLSCLLPLIQNRSTKMPNESIRILGGVCFEF